MPSPRAGPLRGHLAGVHSVTWRTGHQRRRDTETVFAPEGGQRLFLQLHAKVHDATATRGHLLCGQLVDGPAGRILHQGEQIALQLPETLKVSQSNTEERREGLYERSAGISGTVYATDELQGIRQRVNWLNGARQTPAARLLHLQEVRVLPRPADGKEVRQGDTAVCSINHTKDHIQAT